MVLFLLDALFVAVINWSNSCSDMGGVVSSVTDRSLCGGIMEG